MRHRALHGLSGDIAEKAFAPTFRCIRDVLSAVCALGLFLACAAWAGAPNAPDRLRILPDHGATKKASLMWEDNSAAETGFEVQRQVNDGDYATVTTVEANETTWTDSGLDPTKVYGYRVRATKEGEDPSGWSNECSVNFTLSWPMDVAEAEIEMLHGYGDAVENDWFHPGVDIQAGDGGQDCLAPLCALV